MDENEKIILNLQRKNKTLYFLFIFICFLLVFTTASTGLLLNKAQNTVNEYQNYANNFVASYKEQITSVQTYYYECLNSKTNTGKGLEFSVHGFHIDSNCNIIKVD